MTRLTKSYSRQLYPLFFCAIWSDSDLKNLQPWLGTSAQHLVMLWDATTEKVSVWYDLAEIERLNMVVAEKIASDRAWFPSVTETFYDYWHKLLPYLKEEQQLSNLHDLKNYRDWWAAWWSPMAILFEIPNIVSLPVAVRERALAIRAETQDFSDAGEEVIDTFFDHNFPSLAPLWRQMIPEELLRADQLREPELHIIRQRSQGWGLIDGKLLLPDEISAQLTERALVLEETVADTTVSEIKGQPACRGQVRGIVRLLLDGESIAALREGEILVTEMTTPEFVPAMKKAAAIVTDEGGVTCHAAIVSRELNKPCVIGTKIATQVFKDGDEVEVDANTGIVKVINKA